MKTPTLDTLLMMDILENAFSKALDKKRRLGQYAVIWNDGKPTFTEGDAAPYELSPLTAQEDPKPYGDK